MTPLSLTMADIAAAVEGCVVAGDPAALARTFTTDTRALRDGDVFVALAGPRFDGNAFAAEALRAGAAAVIVDDAGGRLAGRQGPAGPAVIVVPETVRALQMLARHVRRASGTTVICLTGSAGKTTTKECIAAFLETRYSVVRNKGNLNNHIGLPLSLLQLVERPQMAVMELGMNHAGEISTLVAIAEPDVRVFTNVGDAHIEFFGSRDGIADAKAEIFEGATRDHLLVCNADDALIMVRQPRFAGRTVTFGIEQPADVRAGDVEDLGIDGSRAVVATRAGIRTVTTPLIGRGNLQNVLAAIAVAQELGVPLDDIVAAAARLLPSDHRGVVMRLKGGVTVIDDSYNSSPAALEQSLGVVARETRAARKVAVLGEMLELGARSGELHERCGRAAAGAGLAQLVTVGGNPARAFANAAVVAGMPASAVQHVATSDEAAGLVKAILRPGDLVLVKGSRGIRTDRVVDRIRTEFA